MLIFDILSKDKPDKVLPSLFRILHSNMSVIAPTGNDFEKDYPEQTARLRQIIPSIEVDDNPCLIIYQLNP